MTQLELFPEGVEQTYGETLPEGWMWTTLSKCTEILDNLRIPINSDEREQRIEGRSQAELYPYYGATGQVGWIDDFIFDGEIVLLGEDGAPFLEPYKHKAYVVRGKSWVNNHAHVLSANSDITSNLYLCHYLNSFDYQGFVSGTTRLKLTQAQMRSIPILLPPLPEQKRIVEAIESLFTQLDAGVGALKRLRANLRRYKAAVLKAACEGKLVPQDPNHEPASVLLERILAERRAKWEAEQHAKGKDPRKLKYDEPAAPDTSDLPELPEGWVWASMKQVGDIQLGRQRAPQHHTGDHMRPYLRVANVFEDYIDASDVFEMNFTPQEYETYLLHYNDILLNEGQSLELVGRSAIYKNEVPGACFTNTLVRFRASEGVLTEYAQLVFRAYVHSGRFQKIAKWTTNIAHLGAQRFAELEFPLPALSEQESIVTEVERLMSIVRHLELTVDFALKRAARLRQAILKQAFEGRLVPQDPNDEQAQELLKRLLLA